MQANYTMPLIDALNVYVTPSIIAFGLPGNLLTTLVFFRTNLKKHSSSFYLGSLAIADAGYLFVLMITILDFHRKIEIYNMHISCQLFNYAALVFANWSVWLIVAFTIERYIALTYPLRRPIWCTVRKAKIITLALFYVSCIINVHIIWVSGVDEWGYCMHKEEFKAFINVVNYLDTILTFILPTIAIIVLNTLITKTVCQYRENSFMNQIKNESFSASTRSSENKSERRTRRIGSGTSNQSVVCRERRVLMARSQCNITKLILLTSTVFLVLNIPSYITRFMSLTYYDLTERVEFIYTQRIFNVLYQANFSVNFLLYAMCGSAFRKALYTYLSSNIIAIKNAIMPNRPSNSRSHRSPPKQLNKL